MTRAGLEKKGLTLRTPPGLRVLEVPAEFAWEQQDIHDRAKIFEAFGFDDERPIFTNSTLVGILGTRQYQFKQDMEEQIDYDKLADQFGIKTDMGRLALREAIANTQLLDKKHHDYGPGNISKFGLKGCLVRGSDKLERVLNLTENGGEENFESIEDNLRDWSNYGVIALICKKGLWK